MIIKMLNFSEIFCKLYYLESIDMKFTFVREINFENSMDDDPANILI